MNKRQGHPYAVVIPLSALVLTVFLLLNAHPDLLGSETHPLPITAELAVEHSSPLTMNVSMSTGKRSGIIEVMTQTTETVSISVPSAWERREVRGGALDAVTADAPSFGFTRWHVPPHVTLSFRVSDAPALTIRNPSGVPLLVLGKRVNVITGEIQERSVLVQDGSASL